MQCEICGKPLEQGENICKECFGDDGAYKRK